MKLIRCTAIGTAGSIALALASFVIAPGTWLTEAYIAPGSVLAIVGLAASESLPPLVTAKVSLSFLGEGPTAFAGIAVLITFFFWAVVIALAYWWVANAPEK